MINILIIEHKLFYRVRCGKLRERKLKSLTRNLPQLREKQKKQLRRNEGEKEDNYRGNHKFNGLTGFSFSDFIFLYLFFLILRLKINGEWHGNNEFEIVSYFWLNCYIA